MRTKSGLRLNSPRGKGIYVFDEKHEDYTLLSVLEGRDWVPVLASSDVRIPLVLSLSEVQLCPE